MQVLVTRAFYMIVIAVLAGTGTALAGDKPASSSGDLQFAVDYCVFDSRADGSNYVEFYLMVYAQGFEPVAEAGQNTGLARIETRIFDSRDSTLKMHNWLLEANLPPDPEKLKLMSVYDQWAELLPAGKYRCRIDISDQGSDRGGSALLDFEVPMRTETGISASQIEFVAKVEAKTAGSPFIKGNRLIFPNPERRYGILNPNLMIYYELYGLENFESETIDIFYEIRDRSDSTVQVFPTSGVKKAGSSVAVTHGFDVNSVPSGIYTLNIYMREDSAQVKLLQSRMFEILQIEQMAQKVTLTGEEERIAGHLIKYFATPQEYRIYEDLFVEEKPRFLLRFWKDRDPDPATEVNEFFVRVQQRYQYANDKFGWLGKEGWETDQGRVLIVYGMPDDIIRNTFEEQTIAHEIWQYDQPRRYDFVFADFRSTGHFILIHSSMEGEVHDENWRSTVRR